MSSSVLSKVKGSSRAGSVLCLQQREGGREVVYRGSIGRRQRHQETLVVLLSKPLTPTGEARSSGQLRLGSPLRWRQLPLQEPPDSLCGSLTVGGGCLPQGHPQAHAHLGHTACARIS